MQCLQISVCRSDRKCSRTGLHGTLQGQAYALTVQYGYVKTSTHGSNKPNIVQDNLSWYYIYKILYIYDIIYIYTYYIIYMIIYTYIILYIYDNIYIYIYIHDDTIYNYIFNTQLNSCSFYPDWFSWAMATVCLLFLEKELCSNTRAWMQQCRVRMYSTRALTETLGMAQSSQPLLYAVLMWHVHRLVL